MTSNRAAKLQQMAELGFTALPANLHNVRHQRVKCSCGKTLPYYRLDVARQHQGTCQAPQPAVQWDGTGNIPARVAVAIAHYFGELAQHPMQGSY